MKRDIEDILLDLIDGDIDIDKAKEELLFLNSVRLSVFQKNRLDLLNWAKSELKQEINTKLGKTITPYRSDKIIFLRRIIKWINNEA